MNGAEILVLEKGGKDIDTVHGRFDTKKKKKRKRIEDYQICSEWCYST